MTETNRKIRGLEPVASGTAAARPGGGLVRSSGAPPRRHLVCHTNPGIGEHTGTDGDKTAFVAALSPIMNVAYRVAFNLTSNSADAEELIQDAALLAYRRFDSFQQGTNFKAWFMKILTNCFVSSVRKQQNHPQFANFTDLPQESLYARTIAGGYCTDMQDPARQILQHLDAEHIAAAFQDLPVEYRMVCVFYFVQEFTYNEIAAQLNVPVGTIRSRLHRGRKMLQQRLWPLFRDAGPLPQRALS